ncbi:PREDICTED: E3 ubiquitin/ISG15 ligase TRIM25-like [Nanorana parkeri]|uniref:E3 ubiquitin/ISG15 ligase TRIM25-like n=1 Tax=Nanorana parkeri TaxID=125878 RepID=UPI000853F85D|nr:PREDICTED: E3 ubiquitin/ISG15 ligase TRIM25-like [Nanorana parkeri]
MASNDLREELGCSICLEIYADPVTLRCGHNFCRLCIEDFLKTQERTGVYSCPECREEFQDRSDMRKNKTLRNIAQHFLSLLPDPEETGIYCTYCDSPVPAARSCVQCETAMCDDHLRKHNKSVQHTLIPPRRSARDGKCPDHQKILDSSCASCRLDGEHRGHRVESPDEASEKDRLQETLEKLTARRGEAEEKVRKLQELRREVQGKAAEVTERVAVLFRDLRRQLEDLENRVLTAISSKEERISGSFSDRIQRLEMEKEELSRKMNDIEILCNQTEPLTAFQARDREDLHDTAKRTEDEGPREEVHDGDLGETRIFETLLAALSDIMSGVKRGAGVSGDSDIELDINTAGNRVVVSGDLKTASWSEENQGRAETAERFEYYQVLSTGMFSSGQHRWDVETSEPGRWRIGLCYGSTTRKGGQSLFGNNTTSWCIRWSDNKLAAMYNGKVTQLPHAISRRKLRIHLDYEAGRISFSELGDPIRHLHTFTTTFTEPLRAAFCVWTGWVRVLS